MKKFVLLFLLLVAVFISVKDSSAYTGEGFEGLTFPPEGWTSENVLGAKTWLRTTQTSYQGDACAYMDYQQSGGDDWLITPANTIASGDSVRFWLKRQFDTPYYPDSMIVYISQTNTVAGFTTRLITISVSDLSHESWTKFSIPLTPYAGQSVYIGFRHIDNDGNGVYMDNVIIGTASGVDVSITSATPSGKQFYSATTDSVKGSVTIQNNSNFTTTSVIYRKINGFTFASSPIVLTQGQTGTANFSNRINFTFGTTYTIRDSVYSTGFNTPARTVSLTAFTPQLPKTFVLYYSFRQNADSMINVINNYYPEIAGDYDTILASSYTGSLVPFKTVMGLFSNAYTPAQRVKMQEFVDAGTPSAKKSLAVFGEDIGYYYDPSAPGYGSVSGTTPADTVFYRQYLRSQYLADIWGYGSYSFVNSNRKFKGLDLFSAVTADTSTNTYPDLIKPVNGGSAAFIPITESGDGDSATAVSYEGVNYNMLYVTIPFNSLRTNGSNSRSPQGVFGVVENWISMNDGLLPVELASFTSQANKNNVKLDWSTISEENNSGFDIERKLVNTAWIKIGNISGNGTSNITHSYSFEDRNLSAGKYNYRLKQIDFNGNYKYYDLSSEVLVGVPNKFEFSQNYPNPFNPSTTINYELPSANFVSLKIYDMTGREVAQLVNEIKQAGYYTVKFNASMLSSGMYFYKIQAGDFNSVKKMMLVK